MLSASPSLASTIPASPSSPPPHIPTDLASSFPSSTSSTAQTTPTIIPLLDISSPATSILPPTPPSSLISPNPHRGLMLSTPSTSTIPPSIPFHLSPSSPISTPFIDLFDTSSPSILPIDISPVQANLYRHPFVGILPGAFAEIFLDPQPFHFIPRPSPSTSIYTPVTLSPLIMLPPSLPLLPSLLFPLFFHPHLPPYLIQLLSPSPFTKPHLPPILLAPPFPSLTPQPQPPPLILLHPLPHCMHQSKIKVGPTDQASQKKTPLARRWLARRWLTRRSKYSMQDTSYVEIEKYSAPDPSCVEISNLCTRPLLRRDQNTPRKRPPNLYK